MFSILEENLQTWLLEYFLYACPAYTAISATRFCGFSTFITTSCTFLGKIYVESWAVKLCNSTEFKSMLARVHLLYYFGDAYSLVSEKAACKFGC